MNGVSGKSFLNWRIASITPAECACAESITTTSTFASTSARARSAFLADADRGAGAQPAEPILRGLRITPRLLNVFDRDQTLEIAVEIDDEHRCDGHGAGITTRKNLLQNRHRTLGVHL